MKPASEAGAAEMAYEANDASAVRELAMSASLAAGNGYRLDWTGTWELETDLPVSALDGATPLRVLITFSLPVPIRAERLLMLGLGLSRGKVRRMAENGRIHLPMALDAKTHQDFEFTVDAPANPTSQDTQRQPDPGRARALSRRIVTEFRQETGEAAAVGS